MRPRGSSAPPPRRDNGWVPDPTRALPPTDELERRVAEQLRSWRVPPGEPVRVTWNARLSTTAGRAFVAEHRIELNPALLVDWPDELPKILVHEAAHIAAHRLFGAAVAAHGRHWRGLMALAGLPPEVSHDLPVRGAARRRRGYFYLRVCDACGGRRIARTVRYGACGCGVADRFLVLRTGAAPAGWSLLSGMPLSEVRRRCIMAGPAER